MPDLLRQKALAVSTVAHEQALIEGVRSEMPGVVKIFTGKDVEEVNGAPCGWQVNFKNGDTMKEPKHPL